MIYGDLPTPLRAQFVHIIRDGLETSYGPDAFSYAAYKFLHESLVREYGGFTLSVSAVGARHPHPVALFDVLLHDSDTERVLDVVQLCMQYIETMKPDPQYEVADRKATPQSLKQELNERFKRAGVGYQYESGRIVRLDSHLLHQEAVKPAIHLLSKHGYEGANDEFLRAHEHYRHGRYKEALNEALKAFESTMKIICAQRRWSHDPNASASRLLEVCFVHGLIPQPLQAHFTAVRATLETGIPTIRNKTSAHGQGAIPVEVPAYLVSYALNITASAIRLLCEAAG